MAQRDPGTRGVAFAAHDNVNEFTQTENDPLLRGHDAEEQAVEDDGCFPPQWRLNELAQEPHADLPVYATIHR